MTKKLRIVLAQLNLTVGDIEGNLQKHIAAANHARDILAAEVIVFSELGITGYPPEDLLQRPAFLAQEQAALETFIKDVKNIYCVVGHTLSDKEKLYNAGSIIYNHTVVGTYTKQHLPNYGVFDEKRYFKSGHEACVVDIHGIPVGLVICEDLWQKGPVEQAVAAGAALILSPNASPFETDKHEARLAALALTAKKNHVAIFYTNNVGAQDEIIFDGGSMVIDQDGKLCQLAAFFQETLLPVDITFDGKAVSIPAAVIALPDKLDQIYQALVLGVRDYIEKNNFPGVLIGLSGGIDSALTLAIAVDALGHERVHAVMMPSRYTADISLEDATAIAKNLDVTLDNLSIELAYESFLTTLKPILGNKKPDFTEENIQARCRAILLMALSNASGALVLTTSNRSELAVGYGTLYGDMAGGFCVLKDIPKMLVYQLALYRNKQKEVIPARIIERAPSAELAHNQKDEDSLAPYAILDKILYAYLNQQKSATDIIQEGIADEKTVKKIIKLIQRNEYKRRQAAIGPRINHYSFGKDWRYPITNRFKCQ